MREKFSLVILFWKKIFFALRRKFFLVLWQLPQNVLGIVITHVVIFFYDAKEIFLFENSIILIKNQYWWGAISLGNIILGDKNIFPSEKNMLFCHEFGHTMQSKIYGPMYLFIFGIPVYLALNFIPNIRASGLKPTPIHVQKNIFPMNKKGKPERNFLPGLLIYAATYGLYSNFFNTTSTV